MRSSCHVSVMGRLICVLVRYLRMCARGWYGCAWALAGHLIRDIGSVAYAKKVPMWVVVFGCNSQSWPMRLLDFSDTG